MANQVNQIILTGKVNYEPNLFDTKKGGKIAAFVLNTYLGKGADDKYRYGNFKVKTFDTDYASSIKKDQKIVVVGKLDQETYTNKEGKEVKENVIIANFLGAELDINLPF